MISSVDKPTLCQRPLAPWGRGSGWGVSAENHQRKTDVADNITMIVGDEGDYRMCLFMQRSNKIRF